MRGVRLQMLTRAVKTKEAVIKAAEASGASHEDEAGPSENIAKAYTHACACSADVAIGDGAPWRRRRSRPQPLTRARRRAQATPTQNRRDIRTMQACHRKNASAFGTAKLRRADGRGGVHPLCLGVCGAFSAASWATMSAPSAIRARVVSGRRHCSWARL
jgi:hypothetical protein